jgi:hypothetical protein
LNCSRGLKLSHHPRHWGGVQEHPPVAIAVQIDVLTSLAFCSYWMNIQDSGQRASVMVAGLFWSNSRFAVIEAEVLSNFSAKPLMFPKSGIGPRVLAVNPVG